MGLWALQTKWGSLLILVLSISGDAAAAGGPVDGARHCSAPGAPCASGGRPHVPTHVGAPVLRRAVVKKKKKKNKKKREKQRSKRARVEEFNVPFICSFLYCNLSF